MRRTASRPRRVAIFLFLLALAFSLFLLVKYSRNNSSNVAEYPEYDHAKFEVDFLNTPRPLIHALDDPQIIFKPYLSRLQSTLWKKLDMNVFLKKKVDIIILWKNTISKQWKSGATIGESERIAFLNFTLPNLAKVRSIYNSRHVIVY